MATPKSLAPRAKARRTARKAPQAVSFEAFVSKFSAEVAQRFDLADPKSPAAEALYHVMMAIKHAADVAGIRT